MRTERIRTDVLIIGGGTAGCFAAYVIGQKSGRKVLIAEKANIKRSGCLAAGVNALNAYITEGRVPQDYVDYAKKDAHGIVREDLLLTMSERLNHVTKVMEDLGGVWSDGQLAVLKKALVTAAGLDVGLLEATEVVEPNPIHPNGSTSYSNLYHCDRDGVYLYIDTVSRQIKDAIRESEKQV